MNDIGSLGVILLLALLAGHLVKWLRVPEVTGYLLAGIALGPSVLGWVTSDNLSALQAFSEVALGLILFSIGTVFEAAHFRRIGREIVIITAIEAALVALIVAAGIRLAGQPWPVALLLGAMAIETAAASTLMVLRECAARGKLTDALTGVFALDNLLCLIAFNLVAGGIQFSASPPGSTLQNLYQTLGPIIWQLVGAAALGYVAGFLLSIWSVRVVEHGEQLILLAGCVLLCVGASRLLHVSSMVANLAVGATVINLSEHGRRFLDSLGKTDPPLYAIFFVLAGADLNLSMLATLGVPGMIYVAGRLTGKFAGGILGSHIAGAAEPIRRGLPAGMFAQAGLAIGLTMTLQRLLPGWAPAVTTVILAAVIVFEIIGPFGVRWTIMRNGESNPKPVREGELLG
ncbi:MAG: cation:proton antiporter [Bryobacterales bacterium]|nr:cation:proton antiporter [Bryobacterales bacterium]